jgi:hypothetical protein
MTDYKKQYDELIETARIESVKYTSGYEVHHIVPRCLNGKDEPSNLVKLWPKEHLRAHWLLTKFMVGSERRKMEKVFEKMLISRTNDYGYQVNKNIFRQDALNDAERFGAIDPGKVSRREGLSLAATKFLASENSRKGRRPLSRH